MARKAILEGGKKDDILKAALELFLKNGYDGTSVRMILEKVEGEIGMFYHYFSSKQEVFDKALELFMKQQEKDFSTIMSRNDENMTPRKKLEQLRIYYSNGMSDFAKLTNGAIHWSVLSAMHDLTLAAILPSFREMLNEIFKSIDKNDISDAEWLAPFILKGISGLMHEKSFRVLPENKQIDLIINFMSRMLQIPQSVFEQ